MPPVKTEQRWVSWGRSPTLTALLLVVCGAARCGDGAPHAPPPIDLGDDSADTDAAEPPEVIVISFSIDDTANQAYGPEDGLAWPGDFTYDPDSNYILGHDDHWTPPHPMLWDDGPLSENGHEPEGAVAGDHVWSVAVFHEPPFGEVWYTFGAMRGSVGGSTGDWIWPEPGPGYLTLPNNPVARGMSIPPFGQVDYRVTVDVNRLVEIGFAPEGDLEVSIRGVPWGMAFLPASDDGSQDDIAEDGVFSFVASAHFGADCTDSEFDFCTQTGLAHSVDILAFWVVVNTIEYLDDDQPLTDGISVDVGRVTDDEGNVVHEWTPLEQVSVRETNWEPLGPGLYVTVPRVAVNVVVDDTATRTVTAEDGLGLAGAFSVAGPGVLTCDADASGPTQALYDDGPCPDGHEPEGAEAGDHIWGRTVWLDSPIEDTECTYRVVRGSVDGSDGPLVTPDAKGTFTVLAGQVAPVWIPPVIVGQ